MFSAISATIFFLMDFLEFMISPIR